MRARLNPRYLSYVGVCGADAIPQPKWAQRRLELLKNIAARPGGLVVNIRHTLKTNTRQPESRDAQRLIKEGFAVLSTKVPRGPRSGHKVLRLTREGEIALLDSGWVPPEKP